MQQSNTRLQEKDFWSEEYSINKWPAVLFFLGPGVVRIHYSGTSMNVKELMSRHLWPAVPQLDIRSVDKLGCAWGEGVKIDRQIQACAVLVSEALNKSSKQQTHLQPFFSCSYTNKKSFRVRIQDFDDVHWTAMLNLE